MLGLRILAFECNFVVSECNFVVKDVSLKDM